jgi:hypothetical protein
MKRKSFIILFVVAALAFTFVPAKSFAAISQGWHSATITYAGPFFDQIVIKVDSTRTTDPFTGQWLVLNRTTQNALLATALSAVSMQLPVDIFVYNDPRTIAGIQVQTCAVLLIAP